MTTGLPFLAVPEFAAVAVVGADGYDVGALSPEEKALIHPRAIASRRHHFVLGRIAAKRALAELGAPAAPVLRGAESEPLWPVGIVGSITHACGYAVAAVASSEDCDGIGVDMEHRSGFFDELIDQVAFGQERVWIRSQREADRTSRVLEVFSAKECIYKAFYPRVRRYFGFEAAQLTPVDDPPGFGGRLIEPLDEEYPPDRSFFIERVWHDDLLLTSLFLPAGEAVHDTPPMGSRNEISNQTE
jgi:4'-phosphopantetheinyl transferase EntD